LLPSREAPFTCTKSQEIKVARSIQELRLLFPSVQRRQFRLEASLRAYRQANRYLAMGNQRMAMVELKNAELLLEER
jgi:exonuclease VII small subunit